MEIGPEDPHSAGLYLQPEAALINYPPGFSCVEYVSDLLPVQEIFIFG